MELYYCPNISNDFCTLDEVESRHCLQVLRNKPGDTIHVTNGVGQLFEATIIDDKGKICSLKINGTLLTSYRNGLQIAIAPTKNSDRLDWFLEKAVEIGIGSIQPIACQHSEKTKMNYVRMKKVMISAMKQSGQTWLPEIQEIISFQKMVDKIGETETDAFICHNGKQITEELMEQKLKHRNLTIFIGPEGGFSEDEVQVAMKSKIKPVLLGSNRLRVETAGLVACVQTNQLLQSVK